MIDDTVLPVACEGYNFAEESAARAQREREQLALWVWDDYWQGQLTWRGIIEQERQCG
jgi:hypothetical protein